MELDKSQFSVKLYRKFTRTGRNLRKHMASILKENGLTGSQYAVLEAIPEDGIPLSAIAKLIWREPSNITGIVDRLEQSGWIRRDNDPKDRRVIRVYKTPEGMELLTKLQKVYPMHIEERLSVLTEAEQHQLMQLLLKLENYEHKI